MRFLPSRCADRNSPNQKRPGRQMNMGANIGLSHLGILNTCRQSRLTESKSKTPRNQSRHSMQEGKQPACVKGGDSIAELKEKRSAAISAIDAPPASNPTHSSRPLFFCDQKRFRKHQTGNCIPTAAKTLLKATFQRHNSPGQAVRLNIKVCGDFYIDTRRTR